MPKKKVTVEYLSCIGKLSCLASSNPVGNKAVGERKGVGACWRCRRLDQLERSELSETSKWVLRQVMNNPLEKGSKRGGIVPDGESFVLRAEVTNWGSPSEERAETQVRSFSLQLI